MSDYYYDYLADCALMIGANELSGLLPPQGTSYDEGTYLAGRYQQQILAAISSTVAMFPFSSSEHDYPPEEFRKFRENSNLNPKKVKRQVSKNELKTIEELVYTYNKKEESKPSITATVSRRNSKYRSRRSIKKVSIDDLNGSWGSVSLETIKSFPATYFSNNLTISSTHINPQIKFIPLTDNMGDRSFAIVIKFYRRFTVDLNNENENPTKIKLTKPSTGSNDDSKTIYVQSNFIVFSKYPYFELYRDILSRLYQRIEVADTSDLELELMEYICILTRVPILKSESMKLTFTIYDDPFVIQRTHQPSNEIVDWDMTILFQILPIDGIISILIAMFQEQKIVFLGDDTNITTIVTETLFLLFRPFHWKHFYLTTTPSNLYELVDAIFPFLLGLPHHMKNKITEYYTDIIIVDLEEGTVSIPKSCNLKYVSNNLTDQLKESLKHRPWLKVVNSVSVLNPITLEEFKKSSLDSNRRFTSKVLYTFMTLMVDLFQEIIFHTSFEKKKEDDLIVANADKFLKTSNSLNIGFFKEIVRTDNYNCFIYDIIQNNVINGWVRICNHRYPNLLNDTRDRAHSGPSRFITDSDNTMNCDDLPPTLLESKTKQEVVLPTSKSLRGSYYRNLFKSIDSLDNTIDAMKIRAEIYLHRGDVIMSLEELHKILKQQPKELNHSKLRKIIRGLKTDNFLKLKAHEFHLSLFEIIKYDIRKSSSAFGHNVEPFSLPTVPITKNDFIDECMKANIAENEAAMNSLFNCLTMDPKSMKSRIKTVKPDIFCCFYHNWINSTVDIIDVKVPTDNNDEIFIKATESCVRVDGFGLGRVALTQFQLLFIPFSKNHCEKIVNFTGNDLLKIKMDLKIRGFGKMVEVIELVINESKVILWLAEATNSWYKLISEISLVNRLAELDKDKSLLDVLAEQCLMFDNMLTCSRTNPYFKTHIIEIGKKMLPHSNEKNKTSKPRNEYHRKYLITKMMPSPKQSVTIDCALVIYDSNLNNFSIWCACMAQNKYFIKIITVMEKNHFIVKNAKIEIPIRIQAMAKVATMNKVVVCCMSHIVFVVNTVVYSIEKDFPLEIGHGSYPTCCFSHTNDHSLVYIGTNSGEVLSCNYTKNQTFHIYKLQNDDYISSIQMLNLSTMIVASLYKFYLIGIDGEMLNVVSISEYKNIMSKMSCLTLTNNNLTILAGLSRLPVVFEYEISDIFHVNCLRKVNLFSKKEFFAKETIDNCMLSPEYVGISSLLVTEDGGNTKHMWVMFKDGTIEVRDYKTFQCLDKFNGHIDVINSGMACRIKNQNVIVSIGREDGKVNLWDLKPSS